MIEWLSTIETARRLGVTPRTVYSFINNGDLVAYRFGRVIRIRETDLASFIESCRIAPGSLSYSGSTSESPSCEPELMPAVLAGEPPS